MDFNLRNEDNYVYDQYDLKENINHIFDPMMRKIVLVLMFVLMDNLYILDFYKLFEGYNILPIVDHLFYLVLNQNLLESNLEDVIVDIVQFPQNLNDY
jgi:hypothetical protein